ncbi:hypothetical protein OBP_042 [Pseudomonas phage OBP]|uniref:hypothetical protein n=1 Tax=Pseudomonas phage OBP TaxID=1124849 RepID=UPI000240D627|nr:hypothetical protein OBP_042 [Pseudomonas phage OBP]AEV89479.1 hypothetical protein OBP_042 [Pseudomonas phage OBP]
MNLIPKTNYIPECSAELLNAWIKYDGLAEPYTPTKMMMAREFYAYPDPGYVVPMEKKPNRRLSNPKTLTMHFLNFLDENLLQLGYPYFFMEDFPYKCLNMVQVLHEMNLIVGYDIDENGFVTYDEEGI